MSSCRKTDIQNNLPNVTKIELIYLKKIKIVVQNKLLCLFYHVLTTIQLIFKKGKHIFVKVKPPVGFKLALGFEAYYGVI